MKSSMSLPEVKMPGWPVISTARTARSAAARSASAMAWYIAMVSAFFFSGRAISIVATPFRVAVLMLMPCLVGQARDHLGPVVGQVHQVRAGELRLVQRTVGEVRLQCARWASKSPAPCCRRSIAGASAVPAAIGGAPGMGLGQPVTHAAARVEHRKRQPAPRWRGTARLRFWKAVHRVLDALRRMLSICARVQPLRCVRQPLAAPSMALIADATVGKVCTSIGRSPAARSVRPPAAGRGAASDQTRSRMPAAPWPMPTHIVTMPYFSWWRRSACTTVAARIAPVAPSGWPSAIAPPIGLTFAGSRPTGVDHRQRLRGKGLVQLDPAHVVELQAGVLQRRRDGLDRADAHDLRRHAARRETDEARQRLQVVTLPRLFAGQDQRAGAVAGLRAVAGGDAALGGEHQGAAWPGLPALVSGRGPSSMLTVRALTLTAGGQVGAALDHLHRRHLVGELAGG
jgi:hypothetical protein